MLRRVFILLSLLAVPVVADVPASQPAARSALLAATVPDVAAAMRAMEVAMRDHPLTEKNEVAQNEKFDTAVGLYFTGQLAGPLQEMHQVERALVPDPDPDIARTLDSFAIHMDHLVQTPDAPLHGVIGQLYSIKNPAKLGDITVLLYFRGPLGVEIMQTTAAILPGDAPREITFTPNGKFPAAHRYAIVLKAGTVTRVAGVFTVVDESLDALKKKLVARLDGVKTDKPELTHALAVCRSRAGLLTDKPDELQAVNLVTDFAQLSEDLKAEVAAIEKGDNPYHHHEGDIWCLLEGRGKLPMRIYAPAKACTDTPMPVVIALHGLGGDENFFMDSYGAGELKTIADQKGFLLISPLSYAVIRTQDALDRMLDQVANDYAIDRSKIYLIGHSLGTDPAMDIAVRKHDKIAAAVLISGLGGPDKKVDMAPTLVVTAGLDRFVDPDGTRKSAKAAQAMGMPIETKEYENYGHMFIVEKCLPDVVDWLLGHQLK